MLFNVFEPKLVDSLLYAMIKFFNHGIQGTATWSQLSLVPQHDAGIILSNVQVLQQLVTALNGVSANVMGAVRGRQPFPTHTMQHALPSCRVRWAAHYMTAMGLWRPPVAAGIRGPLPVATCTNCRSCGDCFPDVPL